MKFGVFTYYISNNNFLLIIFLYRNKTIFYNDMVNYLIKFR